MGFLDEEQLDPITGLPVNSSPVFVGPPAPERDPASSIPPIDINDYIKKKYNLGEYSDDNRKKLQEDSKINTGDGLWAGLSALGAGISGRDAGAAGQSALSTIQARKNKGLEEFDKGRKDKIEDIGLQSKMETESPDSETSKRFRSTLQANFPAIAKAYGSTFDQLTAADAKNIFQVAETKAKLDEAHSKNDIAKTLREDKANSALSTENTKRLDALKNDLDPNKARGGNMAKNQAQIDQAQRLEGLYTEANGDIRNLDSRQMEELAIGLNKMLSGSSSGSVTQVQALLPHTVVGNSQKLKEWLLNDPKGANQQAFVQRMAETVQREKDIAMDQVRGAQVQRLSAYSKLKNTDPEGYQGVISSYGIDPNDIDEKGQYKRKQAKSRDETKSVGGKTYRKVPGGWEEM